MVQIDGIRRQVFIKLQTGEQALAIIMATNGSAEYRYPSGEIFRVNIDHAGLGTKRVRVANLPPEIHDDILGGALRPYGKILGVHGEMWPKAYRYQVSNGIRNVQIVLTKHIPPNLTIAGHKVILTYDGQPQFCYGCGEEGHVAANCPKRQTSTEGRLRPRPASYAMVLASTEPHVDHARMTPLDEDVDGTSATTTTIARREADPPMSQYGTHDQRKTPLQSDDKTTTQKDITPIPNPTSRPELVTGPEEEGRDAMELECTPPDPPNILYTDKPARDSSKDRKWDTPQTTETGAGGDSDAPDKDISMDVQHADGTMEKHNNGTSPKRSKKLKTEKPTTQTHERARSGTRRAMHKGKQP